MPAPTAARMRRNKIMMPMMRILLPELPCFAAGAWPVAAACMGVPVGLEA